MSAWACSLFSYFFSLLKFIAESEATADNECECGFARAHIPNTLNTKKSIRFEPNWNDVSAFRWHACITTMSTKIAESLSQAPVRRVCSLFSPINSVDSFLPLIARDCQLPNYRHSDRLSEWSTVSCRHRFNSVICSLAVNVALLQGKFGRKRERRKKKPTALISVFSILLATAAAHFR